MGDAALAATHLAHQLSRLLAIREVAARLMARDQMGRDFFARGVPTQTTQIDSMEDLKLAYLRVLARNWVPHA